LPEHVVHAERPRFVGNDRNDARAKFFVAQQCIEDAHDGHRRRHLLTAASTAKFETSFSAGTAMLVDVVRRAGKPPPSAARRSRK